MDFCYLCSFYLFQSLSCHSKFGSCDLIRMRMISNVFIIKHWYFVPLWNRPKMMVYRAYVTLKLSSTLNKDMCNCVGISLPMSFININANQNPMLKSNLDGFQPKKKRNQTIKNGVGLFTSIL